MISRYERCLFAVVRQQDAYISGAHCQASQLGNAYVLHRPRPSELRPDSAPSNSTCFANTPIADPSRSLGGYSELSNTFFSYELAPLGKYGKVAAHKAVSEEIEESKIMRHQITPLCAWYDCVQEAFPTDFVFRWRFMAKFRVHRTG